MVYISTGLMLSFVFKESISVGLGSSSVNATIIPKRLHGYVFLYASIDPAGTCKVALLHGVISNAQSFVDGTLFAQQ
jgi:hypothetical protein